MKKTLQGFSRDIHSSPIAPLRCIHLMHLNTGCSSSHYVRNSCSNVPSTVDQKLGIVLSQAVTLSIDLPHYPQHEVLIILGHMMASYLLILYFVFSYYSQQNVSCSQVLTPSGNGWSQPYPFSFLHCPL